MRQHADADRSPATPTTATSARTRSTATSTRTRSISRVYQPSAAERAALAAAGYTGVPASGATAANTPFPSWRCIAQRAAATTSRARSATACSTAPHTAQHNYGRRRAGHAVRRARADAAISSPPAPRFDGSRVGFTQSSAARLPQPRSQRHRRRRVRRRRHRRERRRRAVRHARRISTARSTRGASIATDTLTLGARGTSRSPAATTGRRSTTAIASRRAAARARSTATTSSPASIPPPGVTFSRAPGVNLYAGYSEGSRAPTSIELGCADPNQPCKLPNAMAGDPPLDQVVTQDLSRPACAAAPVARASELERRRLPRRATDDDILFVSSAADRLRLLQELRQDAPAGRRARRQPPDRIASRVGAGYTFLDATYQSAETVNGAGNSTNDLALAGVKGLDGTIDDRAGRSHSADPAAHRSRRSPTSQVDARLSLDVDLVAVSELVRARQREQPASARRHVLSRDRVSPMATPSLNLGGHAIA